jgi:hypothetical protein
LGGPAIPTNTYEFLCIKKEEGSQRACQHDPACGATLLLQATFWGLTDIPLQLQCKTAAINMGMKATWKIFRQFLGFIDYCIQVK